MDADFGHPAGKRQLSASAGRGTFRRRGRRGRPTAIDAALLRRLEHLMSVERAYHREGLTIGSLSTELGVPEYRLRQLINEGLGHRNFNAFLNSYRIEEAKAALADPGQKDVPVLTIAMDTGFQSIGPFNRAFKAATDVNSQPNSGVWQPRRMHPACPNGTAFQELANPLEKSASRVPRTARPEAAISAE